MQVLFLNSTPVKYVDTASSILLTEETELKKGIYRFTIHKL
jgi:hypothetical protein